MSNTRTKDFAKYKFLAGQNISKIFDALGIQYSERYSYITAACPIHKGDNDNAFSWHLEREMFQCFSKGCHEKWGVDIYSLICGTLECDRSHALDFLIKVLGNEHVVSDEILKERQSNKNFVNAAPKVQIRYADSVLANFTYHTYLESRGFPKELIQSYHIGYAGAGFSYMSHRIIVPVRDFDGNIIGFSGRTLYPDWKERKIAKWRESKGFNKSSSLFNIDRAKQYIENTGTAIIVEGPFDVLRLEQAGIHNGVGILGRSLHNGQISLLFRAGASKLLLALDNDNAGRSGAESAAKIARNYFTIENVNLKAKDVGDTDVSELQRIFKAYQA